MPDYTTNYCCTEEGAAREWEQVFITGPDGTTIGVWQHTDPVNFSGHSLPLQPEHKFSGTLTYDVPISADLGTLDVVTIMSWRDRMYVDEANLERFSVPEYTRWDVRANWVSPSGQITVTGFVTNLLDEVAITAFSPRDGNGNNGGVIHGTVTDERRIGVTIGYQM